MKGRRRALRSARISISRRELMFRDEPLNTARHFQRLRTQPLAELIAHIITSQPSLSGISHVSSEPITKFDFLTLIKQTYGLAIEIEPDEDFDCNRSLDSMRFRDAAGMRPPAWSEMIERLRNDATPYDYIREAANGNISQ